MSVVILDAGPLGLLANPKRTPDTIAIRGWAIAIRAAGRRIIVPEIADYEVRRELIRAGLSRSLRLLDLICSTYEYLPIATTVMHRAAQLWADARNSGVPTSHHHSLDGDVILAAQTESLTVPFTVATTNVGHLSRFVPAELWTNIPV